MEGVVSYAAVKGRELVKLTGSESCLEMHVPSDFKNGVTFHVCVC